MLFYRKSFDLAYALIFIGMVYYVGNEKSGRMMEGETFTIGKFLVLYLRFSKVYKELFANSKFLVRLPYTSCS